MEATSEGQHNNKAREKENNHQLPPTTRRNVARCLTAQDQWKKNQAQLDCSTLPDRMRSNSVVLH